MGAHRGVSGPTPCLMRSLCPPGSWQWLCQRPPNRLLRPKGCTGQWAWSSRGWRRWPPDRFTTPGDPRPCSLVRQWSWWWHCQGRLPLGKSSWVRGAAPPVSPRPRAPRPLRCVVEQVGAHQLVHLVGDVDVLGGGVGVSEALVQGVVLVEHRPAAPAIGH